MPASESKGCLLSLGAVKQSSVDLMRIGFSFNCGRGGEGRLNFESKPNNRLLSSRRPAFRERPMSLIGEKLKIATTNWRVRQRDGARSCAKLCVALVRSPAAAHHQRSLPNKKKRKPKTFSSTSRQVHLRRSRQEHGFSHHTHGMMTSSSRMMKATMIIAVLFACAHVTEAGEGD